MSDDLSTLMGQLEDLRLGCIGAAETAESISPVYVEALKKIGSGFSELESNLTMFVGRDEE